MLTGIRVYGGKGTTASQNVARVPAVFRKQHRSKCFREERRMWPVSEQVSREIRHFLPRLLTRVQGPAQEWGSHPKWT